MKVHVKGKTHTAKVTDPRSVEAALRYVIKSWEALPPGEYRGRGGCDKVNEWLRVNMDPAIHAAREVLGLPNKPLSPSNRTWEIQFRG